MTTLYRDDTCAVCGASLPPDHFYCREHAATVDDRLHEIGELLERLTVDVPRLASLLDQVAQETWDYLAEQHDPEPVWPPVPELTLRVHADEVDVDVDTEPGQVRLRLATSLQQLLAAVAAGLATTDLPTAAAACRGAEGLNATH